MCSIVRLDANPQVYEEIRKDNGMSHVLEELMKDVIDERIEESKENTWLESVRNIMNELKYTSDQAMDLLKIPQSNREALLKRLQ